MTSPSVARIRPLFVFRALWPITDMTLPLGDLIAAAEVDLPVVAALQHAEVQSGGRWSVAPSSRVPGSGNITANVLIYEAPAVPVNARPKCPRCREDVYAVVDDSGLCVSCDSALDQVTYEEPTFPTAAVA